MAVFCLPFEPVNVHILKAYCLFLKITIKFEDIN